MEPIEQAPQVPEPFDWKMTIFYVTRGGDFVERGYLVTASTATELLKTLDTPFISAGVGLSKTHKKRTHIGFQHSEGIEWLPLEDEMGSVRSIRFKPLGPKPATLTTPSYSPELIEQINLVWSHAQDLQKKVGTPVGSYALDPVARRFLALFEGVKQLRQLVSPDLDNPVSKV